LHPLQFNISVKYLDDEMQGAYTLAHLLKQGWLWACGSNRFYF